MPLTGSNVTPLELDENLVNGRTYTFQFKCANFFCVTDLSSVIANDVMMQAPSFMTSVGVTSPTHGGWFAATSALYDIQFTYEGDGSDVVSDLAASIIGAIKAVSNDDVVFMGAVQASASAITVTPSQAASAAGQKIADAANAGIDSIGNTLNNAIDKLGSAVNKTTSQALSAILPTLIVVVLIVLYVLPSFAKSAKDIRS